MFVRQRGACLGLSYRFSRNAAFSQEMLRVFRVKMGHFMNKPVHVFTQKRLPVTEQQQHLTDFHDILMEY